MTLAERLEHLQRELGPTTTAFRWFDSPAYTVDRFGAVAVLSVYESMSDAAVAELGRELLSAGKTTAVYLKRRPKEARRVANVSADQLAPVQPLAGVAVETEQVLENGLTFEIRPANGLSVGLYLDARDARRWVAEHSAGRTVANFFAYTCGFGVAARSGHATRALNVDLSRKVLDWGRRNLELNGFVPEPRDFIAGDSFEWLERFAKKGERFDVVVLDPPGFATSPKRRFTAARDYHQLVAAAARVVAPKGTLLAMCNVEALTTSSFEAQLKLGLAGHAAAISEQFSSSATDFALRTLKCFVITMR